MTDSITHQRILLPTDGSDCADEAMRHAADLARRYDAELHLVNVVDTGMATSGMDVFSTYNAGDLLDQLEADADDVIDDAVAAATEAGVDSVEGRVLMGSPYAEILEYVDEHAIDLVVMGTHGRRGVSRALLGSVTEKIVRLASVPVYTVHAGDVDDAH